MTQSYVARWMSNPTPVRRRTGLPPRPETERRLSGYFACRSSLPLVAGFGKGASGFFSARGAGGWKSAESGNAPEGARLFSFGIVVKESPGIKEPETRKALRSPIKASLRFHTGVWTNGRGVGRIRRADETGRLPHSGEERVFWRGAGGIPLIGKTDSGWPCFWRRCPWRPR